MLAEVKEIIHEGLVLKLDDGQDAWLPADEWSEAPEDWQKVFKTLEIGEKLDVCVIRSSVPRPNFVAVSYRQFTATSIDDSWHHKSKIIRVQELTRTLVRGKVGPINVIARQQPYTDYLNAKKLSKWAKDHLFISPGDFIAGIVLDIHSPYGMPELDIAQYLEVLERKSEAKITSGKRLKGDEEAIEETDATGITLTSEEAERFSPVLIVEDDLECRETIRLDLERNGIKVCSTCDSVEARKELFSSGVQFNSTESIPASPRFRLAIIDLNLESGNDQNGFSLISNLQNLPGCRILLLTGEEINKGKRRDWGHLRVNSCLLKPFNSEELLNAINEAFTLSPTPWPDLLHGMVPDLTNGWNAPSDRTLYCRVM